MHIVFLCVANSARSQIAEGLARVMAPLGVHVHSAGSAPTALRALAVETLRDVGVDIATHTAKSVDQLPLERTPGAALRADVVITLCADEVCPSGLVGTRHLHWPVADPAGYDDEPLERQRERFRQARESIRERLVGFFAEMQGE